MIPANPNRPGGEPAVTRPASRPTRVLVVDDSAFMQRRLTEIFARTPDLRVIATANNGVEAISLSERLRPDVITMDINMPKLDGLMAIAHIMRAAPRPIVVISSYTRKCAEAALQALDLGAIDLVEKASDTGVSLDLDRSADEIVRKVRQAARIRVVRSGGRGGAPVPSSPAPAAEPASGEDATAGDATTESVPLVIAVGSSTGGPTALRDLLRAVPHRNFPPMVIVQHLPPNFTRELAAQLNDVSCLNVAEAAAGQTVMPGNVYLAPGDHHLELDTHLRVVLTKDEPVRFCRPSVDVLFRSVARQCASTALGLVLTGMGDDGAEGALALRRVGSTVIAQNEASSLVFGMPRAVIEADAASHVLSLQQIKLVLMDVAARRAARSRVNPPVPLAL